jgi:hypothetical protein
MMHPSTQLMAPIHVEKYWHQSTNDPRYEEQMQAAIKDFSDGVCGDI